MTTQTHFSQSLITNDPAKFSLYLKNREIKEISRALEHIMLLPKNERDKWVEEHGELMNRAFNDFIDSSTETFETGSSSNQFDDEMMELSQDLVVSLQDTFTRVQKILSNQQLNS